MLNTLLKDLTLLQKELAAAKKPFFFGKEFVLYQFDAILFYDISTDQIFYANKQFTKELLYTERNFADLKFSLLPLFYGNDKIIFEEAKKAFCDSPETQQIVQYLRVINKQGKAEFYSITIKRLHDFYCSIQFNNLSTYRQTVLKDYTSSLEDKIKELNRSNKELEDFAYIASHDLQEPLRQINTYGQKLFKKFNDHLDEDGKHYLQQLMSVSARMRQVIDNLLEFSKIEPLPTIPLKVDLHALIKEVLEQLGLNIDDQAAQIMLQQLPAIEGDKVQLYQLFQNLIGNAIKFKSIDRPLHINITIYKIPASEHPEPGLLPGIKYCRLDLSDNGIGFNQEDAEHIFKLFHRLHDKKTYPGTGIGLSTCKKIVQLHKGLISAKGELNKGAIFTIILPENQ